MDILYDDGDKEVKKPSERVVQRGCAPTDGDGPAAEDAQHEDDVEDVEDADGAAADEDEVFQIEDVRAVEVKTAQSCCERDPRCVRGFKHGGKGGKCSYKLKSS